MALAERDSVFAAVAVETGLLKPAGLLAAAARCGAEPALSLAEAALAVGAMTPAQVADVEKVVAHRQELAAAPIATLASFGGFIPAAGAAPGPAPASAAAPLDSFGGQTTTPADLSTPTVPGPDGKATVAGAVPAGRQLDDRTRITAENPGRYEVQSERGRGGIGRVLIALDQHLGREVAVKELLAGVEGQGDAATRFLREARITGRLEHPGIIPVYELGRRAGGSLYYTMKLVRGETFSDRLGATASLPDRLRLLPHFLDLCQAIAYAHDQGVLHRDLKPQNVMVGKFGETVVLDWGLAKVKGVADERAGDLEAASRLMKEAGASDTQQGRLMGTPAYMAPEQAEGLIDLVDERSDVWSLGAIMYEMLAGRRAFNGSLYEVLDEVTAAKFAPVLEAEPQAPRELVAIVNKCLRKDRGQRYQNAGELAEDVARFQSGGLVSAYDYSMATLVRRWVKKRWPVLATAAAALVLLLAVGVFSFISIRAQRNIAVQQRVIAEDQRYLAQQRELEAKQNLSEAYVQYGLQAEKDNRWNDARLLYAQALMLTLPEGREKASSGLYREAVRARRVLLRRTIKTEQKENFPVVVSPDGKFILTGGCQQIEKWHCLAGVAQVWKADTGEQVAQLDGPTDMVAAVAFSPVGGQVAVGSWDGSARLFSTNGEEQMNLSGHSGVTSIAFSPDGKTLITAGDEGEIKTWSTETGDNLATLSGHEGGSIAAALASDGKRLLTGSADHFVRLWDLAARRQVWTAEGDTQWVRAVAVSPDGKLALSGGRDKVLKLWSMADGKKLAEFTGHTGGINAIAFLPGGSAISAADDGDLRVWDVTARRCTDIVRAHAGAVRSLALTPDGKTLITTGADGAVKIWSLAASTGIVSIAAHEGPVSALAYSPDGKSLISGGHDYKIKLWRDGKMVREFTGHTSFVRALAFAPDGKTFASAGLDETVASWDETVRVWNPETGECLKALKGHKGNVGAVAFMPDGRILSGGDDGTVRLWDPNSGQCLKTIKAHEKAVSAVGPLDLDVYHPGYFFSAGLDGKLKMWKPDGSLQVALEADPNGVAVAVHDSWRIATGGFDARLRIWSFGRREPKGPVFPPQLFRDNTLGDCAVTGVTFVPKWYDSHYLASCDCRTVWLNESDGSPDKRLSGNMRISPTSITADRDVAVGTKDGLIDIFPLLFDADLNPLARGLRETGLAAEGFYPHVAP